MSEWKEYKLGDIVDVAQGLAINAKTKHLLSDSGLPLLRITDLIHNTQVQFVKKDLAPKQTIALEEDIIYTRTGQVGLVFKGKIGIIHNNCFKVIPKNNKVTRNYIYWFLRQSVIKEIANSIASGSVQKDLNHSAFKSININVPEIGTQNSISEILSSLDDKIELNNKINQELESLAQLLFKRWFVDFEFPNENGEPYKSSGGKMIDSELGEIPKGWEVISLTDIMDFQGGTQPPSSQFTNIPSLNSIRLIQIRDYYTRSHLTFIPKSSNYKCCEPKDIMIARYGASVGRILFGLEGAYNVALVKVIPIKENYSEYLRSYLNSSTFQDRLLSLSGRSAQAGFNKDDFSSFKIPFPKNRKILDIYEETFSTSIDIFFNNKKEISILEELRDFLLPKLISGELQINDN